MKSRHALIVLNLQTPPNLRRRAMRRWLTLPLAVVCGLVSLVSLGPQIAQADDVAFLDGLRQRRLHGLAEQFCLQRLAASGLTATPRAEWLIELTRTRTDAALHARAAQRDEAWNRAAEPIASHLAAEPGDPRRLLLEVQAALVQLARGEQARREAEAAGMVGPQAEAARTALRTAIVMLRSAAQQAAEQLRDRNLQRAAAAEALIAIELAPLEKNIRYQLARALREQAAAYPARSPDRIAALGEAVELLTPLAQLGAGDPLALRAWIDEVDCYRLLDDPVAAARRLSALEQQDGLPPTIAARIQSQWIELMLARGNLAEAMRLADEVSPEAARLSAELQVAQLQTVLAAWQKADEAAQTQQAQTLQRTAAALVAKIELAHGPYWSRRAEAMLAATVTGGQQTAESSLLLRAAEGFYRAGQLDQALAAYDRTASEAAASGDVATAFDAAFTAGAIVQQRGDHPAAAHRFRELARGQPEATRAAEAHLLAIYNASQNAALGEELPRWLQEHLQRWPQDASAAQARLWLGKLQAANKHWPQAIDTLAGVARETPHYTEALELLAVLWPEYLQAERAAGHDTAERAVEAARFFEQRVGSQGMLPAQFTWQDQLAALSAARIWLHSTRGNEARAGQIAQAALAASSESPALWREEMQSILIVAAAAGGDLATANRLVEQLGTTHPSASSPQGTATQQASDDSQAMLRLVRQLWRLADTGSDQHQRRQIAQLVLMITEQKRQLFQTLSADDGRQLALIRAEALLATDQVAQAKQTLEALAGTNPRHLEVLLAYAELLTRSDVPSERAEALALWRKLESGLPKASERWFQAKYEIAAIHLRQGEAQRALELIQVLELLHPELGGPIRQQQFRALAAKCREQLGMP